MSTVRAGWVVLALMAMAVATASADVVTMKDGSKLLGKVERMEGGKLVLVTEFAGTLEIDATLIDTIATDEPVNVGVDTGDRLVGPIEWKPDIDKAVVQTELGGIPVNVDRIAAIWPRDGKSPETLAMEAQIAQVREEAKAAEAKWSATFEAGLFFTEGNKDIFTARGRVEVRRKSPKDLLKFYLSGDYGEESDERNASEVKAGIYFEHLFTERFFGYLASEVEYDEFENLDLRFSTSLGIGYYWIKKEEHELKTRGGVGFLHESYADETSRDTAQAELGLDYRVDITPWLRFVHGTTYYPTFESLRDYRIVSDTGFIFPLGDSDMWKLKLGAQYEYKSIPAVGSQRLDQTYYANILLDVE